MIKLIYLSTDQLLISQIITTTREVAILKLPCVVSTVYNDDGSMVSFSLEPYLQPFSLFTETYPIGLNMAHVVSVTEPKPNMVSAYKTSCKKMDDQVQAQAQVHLREEGDEEIEVSLEDEEYEEEDDDEIAQDDPDFNQHFDQITRKKETILH
jgi:hypothetical protein